MRGEQGHYTHHWHCPHLVQTLQMVVDHVGLPMWLPHWHGLWRIAAHMGTWPTSSCPGGLHSGPRAGIPPPRGPLPCTWMSTRAAGSLCGQVLLGRSQVGCYWEHHGPSECGHDIFHGRCQLDRMASRPPMIAVNRHGRMEPGAQHLGAWC